MKDINDVIINFFNDNATILFFCCNLSGQIKYTNRFTERLMGSDIIGKEISSIFVDFFNAFRLEDFLSDRDKLYLLNVSTASGLPQTFYFRFYRTGDSILAIGETDSEEMDNLRRNLIVLNSELNNLTRELHKKNAELKKLNELKNQFLGVAAHDLRTPIGAIRNFSEFLLDETRDMLQEEHVHFLTSIKSLTEFMLQLLNDLLDISAIEAGKLQLTTEPVDIVDVIKESIEITGIFAQKKGISVAYSFQSPLPFVKADPIRVKQVLDNLLTNAIKYSNSGTKVSIKAESVEGFVVVSVEDEGPGVPQAEMEKLFKVFSMTSIKSTAGEKSTGLGLAISKKIIDSHGGKIWLEEGRTVGARFLFSLPIAH